MTNDLTEANLEKVLAEIRKHLDDPNKPLALNPSKVLYIPADLTAVGLTHDDVVRMLK